MSRIETAPDLDSNRQNQNNVKIKKSNSYKLYRQFDNDDLENIIF